MKVFLDQLVRDEHLKEFIDEENTRIEKVEARTNPRFDQGNEEINKALDEEEDEDLLLGTIHMIEGANDPDLMNRI